MVGRKNTKRAVYGSQVLVKPDRQVRKKKAGTSSVNMCTGVKVRTSSIMGRLDV